MASLVATLANGPEKVPRMELPPGYYTFLHWSSDSDVWYMVAKVQMVGTLVNGPAPEESLPIH